MKKSLAAFAGVMLLVASGSVFAEDEATKIGEQIYKKAFGRGCGSCHDIKTNPQLSELIKEGKLSRGDFEKTLKEGKNGMPKAIEPILAVKAVKDAGYGEDQAVDAIYKYLESK
jgi:mono/diheme cytochrome c family protein